MAFSLWDMLTGQIDPAKWAAFKPQESRDAMLAMPEVPLMWVGAYVLFVFGGQLAMKNQHPFATQQFVRVWNLILAVFSITGLALTFPYFSKTMTSFSLYEQLCTDATRQPLFYGQHGFWLLAFILSKIPELFDTFWLVLGKKPVIFLHWYHHVTVLLYCWHSWLTQIPAGTFFMAMNYSVHSVMYSYYFLMTFSQMRFLRSWATFITLTQISQMVVGFAIAATGGYFLYVDGRPCNWDKANNAYCAAMYFTYFLLFFRLFLAKSSKKDGKKSPKSD